MSNPRFPLSAPTKWMNGWPTLVNVYLGSNVKQRGNVKRSALGECSLRKDTRVETANEGRFSSQICSERVEMESTVFLNSLTLLSKGLPFHSLSKWPNHPRLFKSSLAHTLHSTTAQTTVKRKRLRQNWHWQVPFIYNNIYISTRHSRVRRGREKIVKVIISQNQLISHSPKDPPSSKFQV
jgi:hypothetical protein